MASIVRNRAVPRGQTITHLQNKRITLAFHEHASLRRADVAALREQPRLRLDRAGGLIVTLSDERISTIGASYSVARLNARLHRCAIVEGSALVLVRH